MVKKKILLVWWINILWVSVMGVNDGIILVVGIVIGVVVVISNSYVILIVGLLGVLVGMILMVMGEYVLVFI